MIHRKKLKSEHRGMLNEITDDADLAEYIVANYNWNHGVGNNSLYKFINRILKDGNYDTINEHNWLNEIRTGYIKYNEKESTR